MNSKIHSLLKCNSFPCLLVFQQAAFFVYYVSPNVMHMFNCFCYTTIIAEIWLTFSYFMQWIIKVQVPYTDPGYNSIFPYTFLSIPTLYLIINRCLPFDSYILPHTPNCCFNNTFYFCSKGISMSISSFLNADLASLSTSSFPSTPMSRSP